MKSFLGNDPDSSVSQTTNIQDIMASSSSSTEEKITRMADAFPIYLKGPNDLQEYITRFLEMKNKIRQSFEAGLEDPLTSPDRTTFCRLFKNHHADMCRSSHRRFISKTIMDETTGPEEAEAAIDRALQQLERFRKMLVDNKRHRKTTHTQNRAACLHFKNEAAFNHALMSAETELENDPRENHPCVLMLKQMNAASNEHHRTVAKKILKEVNDVVLVIRQKLLLAYQIATENATGAIIQHAEKSYELIQKIIQLAMVEFCATVWWENTQKDPMDHANYYLIASSNPDDGQIRIVVKKCLSDAVVFDEFLNHEFAETIMTPDAVQAFEDEHQPPSFVDQEAAAMERNMYYYNQEEPIQFCVVDQARVATEEAAAIATEYEEENAWNELINESDGDAADACSMMDVDEFDNDGSDYEPDTCGGYYN